MATTDRWYERHAHLPKRMREINSRPVDIWRGGILIFTAVSATTFELRYDELLAFGAALDVRRMDYMITIADTADEVVDQYQPQLGDEVRDAKNGTIAKVSPLGEAIFRWESGDRKVIRLHTHLQTWTS